jgi:enterochelin esterase family protein
MFSQQVASPRLSAILALPAETRGQAVDELVDSLERFGGPLVERQTDAIGMVTFLWRGDRESTSAVVVTPSTLYDFDGSIMSRIDGTDVWFRSLTTPPKARFAYRFEIDGPLTPFDKDPRFFARPPTWFKDPTNPRIFVYETGDTASVLELVGAPDGRWSRRDPGRRAGSVEHTNVESSFLRGQRSVWIYRPPGYDTVTAALPVLVLTDGDSYLRDLAADRTLDNLIHEGQIPPILAVGVTSPSREDDLACNAAFGDFIAMELLPWLASTEHATDRPQGVALGGYSLGGLAAACAALRHSDRIGMVLAQSGSFRRAGPGDGEPEGVARSVSRMDTTPVRFYVEVGIHEVGPFFGGDPSTLTANRHLRDVLIARGYEITYAEHASGHEPVAWRESLHLGLIDLFGR